MKAKKTNLFSNGLIWFGAGVSLAEILTGTYFAPLGFGKGLLAILAGHLIGCVMLFAAGLIGGQIGKSAMETTKLSFGGQGAKVFAALTAFLRKPLASSGIRVPLEYSDVKIPPNITSTKSMAIGMFLKNCTHESIAVTLTSVMVMPEASSESDIVRSSHGVSFAIAGFITPNAVKRMVSSSSLPLR